MQADIIVIGAGVAGLSAAYTLAEHAHVIVLEREAFAGYHSSGRSAALLVPSLGSEVVQTITAAGAASLHEPPIGFDRPVLNHRGALWVANKHQTQDLKNLMSSTVGMAPCSPDQAVARVPILRRDWLHSAAYEDEVYDIDVHVLIEGFRRGIQARGGRFLAGHTVQAANRQSGLWRIETPQAIVSAPIVVNAAGAWADPVGQLFGAQHIGFTPMRRTAATVEAPDGLEIEDWPFIINPAEDFYVKPDAGRLLISPADETHTPPCDAQPEELDIAIGIHEAQQALDIEVRHVQASWAGLRTFAPDREFVIGFDTLAEGYFWLAGQGGVGVQTCFGAAAYASGLILNGPSSGISAIDALRDRITPARFAPAETRIES
ncbi:MAG: FAD-binding oxidoreductase [Henriciella sp.]|nr:FAD-binding oxidoreductase [Henriciella sp.]